MLPGNSNPWLAVVQQLDHPIVAERIRFLPYSHHPRTTCMRVEVYGCHWRGGLVSYASRRSAFATPPDWADSLDDVSYDGATVDGVMTAGLGQLTDGVIEDNRTAVSNATYFGKFDSYSFGKNISLFSIVSSTRCNKLEVDRSIL